MSYFQTIVVTNASFSVLCYNLSISSQLCKRILPILVTSDSVLLSSTFGNSAHIRGFLQKKSGKSLQNLTPFIKNKIYWLLLVADHNRCAGDRSKGSCFLSGLAHSHGAGGRCFMKLLTAETQFRVHVEDHITGKVSWIKLELAFGLNHYQLSAHKKMKNLRLI